MNDTPQKDPKKLFVGNIPWSMTEEDLVEIFSAYGEVADVHLVTERHSGRSKGIAFVAYNSAEEAAAAIKGENEKEYEGRPLRVDVARPRQPRSDRGGYNNNRGSGGY